MEISDLRKSPIEESFGESGHRGFTPTDEGVRGVGGGQTSSQSTCWQVKKPTKQIRHNFSNRNKYCRRKV